MRSSQGVSGRGHLPQLESEGILILREVAAQFERPALLFSGGKDSIVAAWLARKAFAPARVPFPLLHIDTGHNFPETLRFRDDFAKTMDCTLLVRHVQDSIDRGRVQEETGASASRNALQTVTLLDAIKELGLDVAIGGARRDEEKAPARKSASFPTVTSSDSGTRGISALSCGTSTTDARTTASTSACSRCQTGPNSISGNTSPPRRSRCRSCTSHTSARPSSGTACCSRRPNIFSLSPTKQYRCVWSAFPHGGRCHVYGRRGVHSVDRGGHHSGDGCRQDHGARGPRRRQTVRHGHGRP
jgi:hypothetical protein